MRFEAKIDWWIKLLMYGSVLVMVPMIFFVPSDEIYILGFTIVIMGIIIIPLVRYAYYELQEDQLYIKLGYIHAKIKYVNIKRIEESHSMMSGYALSMDKVKIIEHHKSYLTGTTYISPLLKEEFIYELQRRCPNLETKEDLY